MSDSITTAAEARDAAIEWQTLDWLSLEDLEEGRAQFEALAERFPELREEFEENGII